jgi:hypothetical protein
MTRLRHASVIAVLFSLAWAWILWSQGVRNKMTINWFTVGAYASYNECRTALQEAAENLQNSGYELVDTAESITAIKDNDNFTGLTCLPDTVDPRGPKGSGRRESPRRVLRRRTGCGGVVAGRASRERGAQYPGVPHFRGPEGDDEFKISDREWFTTQGNPSGR